MAFAQASHPKAAPIGGHYADTISAVHPDRPIRPLPKRRLKKISDTQSGSDSSPLASGTPEKLFQLPYFAAPNASLRPVSRNSSLEAEAGDGSNSDSPDDRKARMNLPVRPKATQYGSRSPTSGSESWIASSAQNGNTAIDHRDSSWQSTQNEPQSLVSSAESVDGYDSFENTNNKKKRKIPTNGGHHPSLSTEMASMGLPSTRDLVSPSADIDGGVGHYYGSGSSATSSKPGVGLSGAGRGRIGRVAARRRSNRSPLGVSTNGGNLALPNYATSAEMSAKENFSPVSPGQEDLDRANGVYEKGSPLSTKQGNPQTPSHSSSKGTPGGKTQFTFTCESDSAKSISWPEYGYPSLPGAYPDAMPNGVDGAYDTVPASGSQNMPGYGNTGNQAGGQRPATGTQMGQPRRSKRSLAKQYNNAAKERKVRQAYGNFHHPPKVEDVWICEYCEYEAIFGSPPLALIRQYEIKDRRERRRLAEKQRLLEKAKMRNKRGKKGGKNSKNANAAAQAQQQQQTQKPRTEHLPGEYPQDNADLPADEYLLDDYDENPSVTPTLPPKAPSKAAVSQHNTQYPSNKPALPGMAPNTGQVMAN